MSAAVKGFGLGMMSDLSPYCASKQTSARATSRRVQGCEPLRQVRRKILVSRSAPIQWPVLACFDPQWPCGVVGQFDSSRVPRWKMTDSGSILAGWHERNTNPC
jgi:hypothetical protein